MQIQHTSYYGLISLADQGRKKNNLNLTCSHHNSLLIFVLFFTKFFWFYNNYLFLSCTSLFKNIHWYFIAHIIIDDATLICYLNMNCRNPQPFCLISLVQRQQNDKFHNIYHPIYSWNYYESTNSMLLEKNENIYCHNLLSCL